MSRGVNKVILIGNLGQDPETRHTANGTAVCSLSVATSRRWKDKQTGDSREETEWHRVILWGRLGEVAGQYLSKGARVYIEGRLRTQKWQDRQGQDRYTTEIVAEDMQMLGERQQQREQAPQHEQAPRQSAPSGGGFEDDIPFAKVRSYP